MRLSKNFPYLTLFLVIITIIIHIFRMIDGGAVWELLSARWNLLYNQPWRIVTSPFIHHDFPHILINLIFFILFGRQIERSQGRKIYLSVFFGALVVGHITSITFMHDWIVGISGGVCGLFGLSLVTNRREPWWTTLTHNPLHLVYFLFLVTPFIPFIANLIGYRVAHFDHLGGVLYGLAFGTVFLWLPRNAVLQGAVIALPFLLFATLFYSPWQDEWRLIKDQPPFVSSHADCRLASTVQETYVPSVTYFVNNSNKKIGLFWIDYEGRPQLYSLVSPGRTSEEHTFIGNAWCVVEAENGEAYQVHLVKEIEETFIIP